MMNRCILIALLALATTATACAQPKVIWQIGKYDQSDAELRNAAPETFVFRVGESASDDWPQGHYLGSRYEIQFPLTNAAGRFTLDISLLAATVKIPALKVQVNGHSGLFYLRPRISYATLEANARPSERLKIDIPRHFLHSGSNTIALSCLDTHAEERDAGGAGFRYDALSLIEEPHAAESPRAVSVTMVPTIFYQQEKNGLAERVDALLSFAHPVTNGTATLTLGGRQFRAVISAADFGQQRLEFEVPEWTGTPSGRIAIRAGVHTDLPVSVTPAKKWTLFVVPHTHVDIGYTDYQGKVAEIQARTLDEATNLIHAHPTFRFTTDGSWNIQQYLATRSKARQQQVMDLAHEDKIGIPADYFNLLTGYASLETLYRSLYYSKWLSRTWNIPFDYASTTDVPSWTGAYPSVLASSGIRYWVGGGNNDRAPILYHAQWNRKSPFWWQGPDGKKVLFWYSRSYGQIQAIFGLPPDLAAGEDSLPIFLDDYSTPAYKPDVALIYGAQYENTDLNPALATFAGNWNQKYAYPKLQYATFPDFFRYIDQHYGCDLATYKGDMGPYWEDGVGGDAYFTGQDRDNQGSMLAAETASTIAHTVSPDLHPPTDEVHAAWRGIEAFAEHTWGAGNSVSQPDSEEAVRQLAVKDNFATQAHFEIADLANRAMSQLADQIHLPSGTLVALNTLNWKRDALLETDLREHQEIVDMTTGAVVPLQVAFRKEGFVHVRFLARDLPPVGYKCFQIRSTHDTTDQPPQIEKSPVIENQYYRITVDLESGALRSIYDKQLQRELVDQHSPYRFGQYLYVTGGDGSTRMIHPTEALPVPELTIHPAQRGEYLGTEKTPWGDSIRLRSSDLNTPTVDLEVLLFNNSRRIEFRYTIDKQYTTSKEGVYFAFPVALSTPQFGYAIQQGWVNPAKDLLPGASLEWFTIQHWMSAFDANFAVGIVPVNAPLASLGDINRGMWPGEFHPKSSTIFSYAMNNYWHTNYPAGQGGRFTFRYVLTSAGHLDPAALARLGRESMEPVVLDHVVPPDKSGNPARPLPDTATSFLQIDSPNIVLVDWKMAEDGRGTILRLEETAGQQSQATIRAPQNPITTAQLCNSVEDDLQSLPVSGDAVTVHFRPYEVLTIRLNAAKQCSSVSAIPARCLE